MLKPNFVMKTTPKKTRQAGFALIVTLSLMILLTVIAVGLLTLSTVSLRSTSQSSAQATANANARLALMMAIGDLQKHLGPDQRISADAGSFKKNSEQANTVGVWDSLGYIITDTTRNEGVPPRPAEKAAKFRTWLLSTRDMQDAKEFNYVENEVSGDFAWLTNPQTTGPKIDENDTTMKAERIPISVGTSKGGMAWMVSDNSTKAQVNIVRKDSDEVGLNIANRTAGTAPNIKTLSDKLDIANPDRVVSMQTAALAVSQADKSAKNEVTARVPALTSSSLGLLTNVVLGGLKTDLTPIMETGTSFNLTTALGGASPYANAIEGAPSWNYLRSRYGMYKSGRIRDIDTAVPKLRVTSTDLVGRSGEIYDPRPTTEKYQPVIAKLQILFSIVAHNSHIGARRDAYQANGQPPGWINHAVPHLVYDPVVTLYNPYDVQLELNQVRIRVTDPPVGFQFQKHDKSAGTSSWYRNEFASGQFHGLGRFQITEEYNPTAKKIFVLFLKGQENNAFSQVKLLPGETKVFSAYVQPNWSWGLETSGPNTFFDHAEPAKLGTRDPRTGLPGGTRGLTAVPGLDFRAGLQTDHMSYGGFANRPANSRYSWETNNGAKRDNMGEGWVSLRVTDEVTVNCKPVRTTAAGNPDFKVDLLANSTETAADDVARTYSFTMADPAKELLISSGASMISRTVKVGDILQKNEDQTADFKLPFAIFTMTAKTTLDDRDDSKSWAFNNLVTEGVQQNSTKIGNAAQSYDLRLQEVGDYTVFPGIEIDSGGNPPHYRGYFGAKATADQGVSAVPMYRVPVTPAASLGDWIGGNLISSSAYPRVNYPLGNSFAHPLIPVDDVVAPGLMALTSSSGRMLDHSYLLNATMWDRFYFSSAVAYTGALYGSSARTKTEVINNFFTNEKPMLNSRLIPYLSGGKDALTLASEYNGKSELPFSKSFAQNAMIQGAFNVNSSSVDAWRSVLSSLRDSTVVGFSNRNGYSSLKKTPFVRTGLPLAGSADDANPESSVELRGQVRWAGFRNLTDEQIKELAERIVDEIRIRNTKDEAPSLSLGDFINRRLDSNSSEVHAMKGILQTAIDKSSINTAFHQEDSRDINPGTLPSERTAGLKNKDALKGFTGDGAAPMLSQGDLLTALAPVITTRGDTFTIRSYGEARATNGTTVLARAWCEATVQRVPEYVDPANAPDIDLSAAKGDINGAGSPLTDANKLFGRRFVLTSFRWLNSTEI